MTGFYYTAMQDCGVVKPTVLFLLRSASNSLHYLLSNVFKKN